MIPNKLLHEIHDHALELPDQEVCGLVIDDQIVRSANVAPNPAQDFELDSPTTELLWKLVSQGTRPIVYHTHCNHNNDWSLADIKACKQVGVPYFLWHPKTGTQRYYDPTEQKPLLDREWHWLVSNCYTLTQDFYRDYGIKLDDFYLQSPKAWESSDWNEYLLHIESQNFVRLAEHAPLQKGDFILMTIGARNPNHGAVLIDVEGNRILHHLVDHLSRSAPYNKGYRHSTFGVYSHVSLLNDRPRF